MKRLILTLLVLSTLTIISSIERASAQTILISKSSFVELATSRSYTPDVSTDSRYIVFASDGSELVQGDQNNVRDVFLHFQENLQPNSSNDSSATTIRISVNESGQEGNGASRDPRISANGRWVVFSSEASNLVAGDNNGVEDIFLYDRIGETIRRISVPLDSLGMESGESNGASVTPSITGDGCYIAYATDATNLQALGNEGTPLADTNGHRDIILYTNPDGTDCDLNTAMNEFLSLGPDGVQANGDSSLPEIADTRLIGFISEASNLVSDDTNGVPDAFVRDRAVEVEVGRETLLVSRTPQGAAANGATFSIDIDNGGDLTFDSEATDLVEEDTNEARDVFRRFLSGNRVLGTTILVSARTDGTQGNAESAWPRISAGGNYVAFASDATNLADRTDCNNARDIFLQDNILGTLRRMNLSTSGYQAGRGLASDRPSISSDGFMVVYESEGRLLPSDSNGVIDIYGSVASQDPRDRDNPLLQGERLDEAPDICVRSNNATIFMERYSAVGSTSLVTSAANELSVCPPRGFCYTVEFRPTGPNAAQRERVRKISKRNQTSVRNIPPGSYRVSFRASGTRNGTTIKTNRSPARTVKVRQ